MKETIKKIIFYTPDVLLIPLTFILLHGYYHGYFNNNFNIMFGMNAPLVEIPLWFEITHLVLCFLYCFTFIFYLRRRFKTTIELFKNLRNEFNKEV
jgi:hypothetical protein